MGVWTDKENEQRQWPRLELQLNVEYWSAAKESPVSGTASTANVSVGGVYFLTSDWERLRPGQNLELRLSGLAAYSPKSAFRNVSGKATILRVDKPESADSPESKAGVAVRFHERPGVGIQSFWS